MASQLPPADNEEAAAQAERHSQDRQHASSASESQDSDAPDGPLRTATTFGLEDEAAPGQGKNGAAAAKAAPSPGLLEKFMQKLGLNPIILMSMFKSVLSPSASNCPPWRTGANPWPAVPFVVGRPSHPSYRWPYTRPPGSGTSSRLWATSLGSSAFYPLPSCRVASSSRT